MPDLVMDEHRFGLQSEQIDTDQEDHVSDEVMYACTSRPWLRHVEKLAQAKIKDYKFEEKEESSWKTV